jgi:hypothetical protein
LWSGSATHVTTPRRFKRPQSYSCDCTRVLFVARPKTHEFLHYAAISTCNYSVQRNTSAGIVHMNGFTCQLM